MSGVYQINLGPTVSISSPGKAIHTRGTGGGTINTAASTIDGDIITDVGNDTLNWTAGTLNGEVHLGDGSDTITISSNGYIGTELLDGGDDVGITDGMLDVLTFSNIQANVDGSKLLNWENIIIDNSAIYFTTQIVDGTLLTNQNGGIISLENGSAGDILTINQDYTGTTGSELHLETVLSSATSVDNIHIQGKASGDTQIIINNLSGLGAATTGNGILLVQIDGTSTATFSLAGGSVRVGNYLYSLVQVGNNWFLQSIHSPLAIPALNQTSILVLITLMLIISYREIKSRTFK